MDILIVRRRDRAYIIPESEKGRRWILEKMTGVASAASVSVSSDVASELEINLRIEGLEVDVR